MRKGDDGGENITNNKLPLVLVGSTIFDCELGCFISVEEFHRRHSENNSLHSEI